MRNLKMASLRRLSKKEKGNAVEILCEHFLCQHGISILARNFSAKQGEIDLIGLENNDTVVFYEVRYRQYHAYGTALESINRAKQQRIIKTALFFLATHAHLKKHTFRFDIVGASSYNGKMEFNWQKDAFQYQELSWI